MRKEKWERRNGKGEMGKEKDRREKRLSAGMTRAESLSPFVAKIL